VPLLFQPARPDEPEAAALLDELSAELARITGDSGLSSSAPGDFTQPGAVFLLALAAGIPVGCGGIRPFDERTGELKRMYSRVTNKGVGARLLSRLELEARRLGYARLRLETRRVNRRAVQFYLKHGYAVIPNYGRYADRSEAVCFEKVLPETGVEPDGACKGG
jgi:GNAT superfamily N-acetyltransferase